MSDAENAVPRRTQSWHRRPWVLVALALGMVVLSAMLFAECHARSARTVDATPPISEPAALGSASILVDAAVARAPSIEAPGVSATATRGAVDGEERTMDQGCKRAPIRGCAPIKDERGCYHCGKCWRPLHYDIQNRESTVSFRCPEMADAPLYVDLSDASIAPGTTQHWAISASFGDQRLEQLVTPNLGGAFFAGFHGGNVDLTATLKSCDPPDAPCRGDLNVTLNARPDGSH